MQWANERSRVRVLDLDQHAQASLRDWLERARQAGIDVTDLADIDAAYERYLQQVRSTAPEQRGDPTMMLTTIAVAMGEYLQARSQLTWKVAEDAQGPDLALTSKSGMGVLFPIDPVADAWAAQRTGWLAEFVDGVLNRLELDRS